MPYYLRDTVPRRDVETCGPNKPRGGAGGESPLGGPVAVKEVSRLTPVSVKSEPLGSHVYRITRIMSRPYL